MTSVTICTTADTARGASAQSHYEIQVCVIRTYLAKPW